MQPVQGTNEQLTACFSSLLQKANEKLGVEFFPENAPQEEKALYIHQGKNSQVQRQG